MYIYVSVDIGIYKDSIKGGHVRDFLGEYRRGHLGGY